MDRTIVYPGAIPLDTDLLSANRNAMIGIGALAQMVLGTGTVVDGLSCIPTAPATLGVIVGPGSIAALQVVDALSYGSLSADIADPLVKVGTNLGSTPFTFTAPATSGQAINWLVEAAFAEADVLPVVLPYYNAANPVQTYAGPGNSGAAQNTLRTQRISLQLKQGAPAASGSQLTPAPDSGWVGLYAVTVQFAQATITAANIVTLPTAPFILRKLPQLLPGFASGVQSFPVPGAASFTIPQGVTQIEVEVWGGGSGSFASQPNYPSGGGSGGGYARKRITGLTPGQTYALNVGSAGTGGTTAGFPASAGGSSNFGGIVSASGGGINILATLAIPSNGNKPAGNGSGGDVNVQGCEGSHGLAGQGAVGGGSGMGGAAALGGGGTNGGNNGSPGNFPGGGASGAGAGTNGTTAYNGSPGAGGLVVVRW